MMSPEIVKVGAFIGQEVSNEEESKEVADGQSGLQHGQKLQDSEPDHGTKVSLSMPAANTASGAAACKAS